ncbi:integrase [Plasticicumulans acidivorans]|uniref:Integrase n=1 Tax=Plasticicumulans acidivorans TaxID=886464 RepID=A0A317MSG4_9GAMM|nr:integrase [Plasticicumulans acidivorans]
MGGYPAVTLQQVREKAREVREKIAQGIDPIAERKAARSALMASRATEITFEEAAKQYIAAKSPEWKNAKHAQQWGNTLETYAFPKIGKLQVRDIDTPHVLEVLEPIWTVKTETASRVRGRIEAVLDWATVRKYRDGQNPARWKGYLDSMLPEPTKVAKNGNHAALPFAEASAFMKHLRKMDGTGARALEFTILTAARSGEVRGATWDEIDLEARVWTIPAGRMKMGKEHEVPLTEDAVALLKALPRFEDNNLVFPASRGGELSDMTLAAVIKRMHESETKAGRKGYIDPKQADKNGDPKVATPHGFRSTFRDWAAEQTDHPREVAEMALAHSIESKVEAHYRRGNLLQKRRALMEDWASFCHPKK